jgi:hypothetical protein
MGGSGSDQYAQTARAAKNGPPTFDSLRKKQDGECWQFAQRLYDQWHIAAVTARYAKGLCPICHSRENRSRRILRSSFYIDGCVTLRAVALRWQVFKQKKGSATISLGLNYCSMR